MSGDLTPEALQRIANAAIERERKAAIQREKAEAKSKADRLEKAYQGLYDDFLRHAPDSIERAAKNGQFRIRLLLATTDEYDSERLEAVRRAQKALCIHFRGRNLKAEPETEYHTAYVGSMDPSPVPDGATHYIDVSWKP